MFCSLPFSHQRSHSLCTGSGCSLLKYVSHLDIDLYITGDITHHHALQAKELGLNVLELEHFETEKFLIETIYSRLVKLGISKALLVKSKKNGVALLTFVMSNMSLVTSEVGVIC